MMNQDQIQISGAASVETEDKQTFQANPASAMKASAFAVVELKSEEMEAVAGGRPRGMGVVEFDY